jgi:hypothetical protein
MAAGQAFQAAGLKAFDFTGAALSPACGGQAGGEGTRLKSHQGAKQLAAALTSPRRFLLAATAAAIRGLGPAAF